MDEGLFLLEKTERMLSMQEKLKELRKIAEEKILAATSPEEVEKLRVDLLGKKGELTKILKEMGKLSAEERPIIGKLGNEVREIITNNIKEKKEMISRAILEQKIESETIDVTMPGKVPQIGKQHIISKMIDEVTEIFMGMGFSIAEGPEIETVRNNFDALNAPKDHPSRDMTDTFYITEDILLRTQTSPVQIRTMEKFVQKLYGPETKTKFRPHNFPFTEPSAEIDVSCFKCGGAGCPVCKGEGWIEILGAGMVHPNVLRNCGIDPDVYSGFAAGMGVERLAMLKYGIDDIRLMFENDVRFLDQF